jgi:hypothetical protein
VPVVERRMVKLPPGPIVPEFHAPLFDVEVCEMLSMFVHVTIVPAVRFSGLIPNAFVPRAAAPEGITTMAAGPPPGGITTIDAGPPSDGAGVGNIGLCDVL